MGEEPKGEREMVEEAKDEEGETDGRILGTRVVSNRLAAINFARRWFAGWTHNMLYAYV